MENWLVVKHEYVRWLLDQGFDSVGINAINHGPENAERSRVNPSHSWHYSGNFWWASHSHLASLVPLQTDTPIITSRGCSGKLHFKSLASHVCRGDPSNESTVYSWTKFQGLIRSGPDCQYVRVAMNTALYHYWPVCKSQYLGTK